MLLAVIDNRWLDAKHERKISATHTQGLARPFRLFPGNKAIAPIERRVLKGPTPSSGSYSLFFLHELSCYWAAVGQTSMGKMPVEQHSLDSDDRKLGFEYGQ